MGVPLTVVLAVTEPWPAVKPCLEALVPQVRALGAEVIVASNDGRGVVREASWGDEVAVMERPGASPYRCRAEAIARARGEIVAVIEDHCVPSEGYCREVLAAHTRHPEAAVIGGSVDNGAREALIDEASFFISNTAFVRPVAAAVAQTCVFGQANVSFKRASLAAHQVSDRDTLTELQLALRAAGVRFAVDERVHVVHDQRLGTVGTVLVHFDDARCRTCLVGDERERGVREAARRIALGPWRIASSTARIAARVVMKKPGYRLAGVRAAPAIALLIGAQVAGEIAGLIAGPGSSPARMH